MLARSLKFGLSFNRHSFFVHASYEHRKLFAAALVPKLRAFLIMCLYQFSPIGIDNKVDKKGINQIRAGANI